MYGAKTSLTLAALLLVGPVASAGPTTPHDEPVLGLETAVRIAVENNLQITAANARLHGAAAKLDEAKAHRLPRLEIAADYTRTTNPVLVFGNLLRQQRFGPENFDIRALNHPDPLGNWNGTISLYQPIWTGGAVSGGRTVAEHALEATDRSVDRTRQVVTHQVVEAYASAVLARYQLDVALEVHATAQAHVQLVDDLHRGGLALQSDVLQAKLRASETQEFVIRAESAIEVSTAALNMAMGRDLDTPVDLPGVLELTDRAAAELAAVDPLVRDALGNRPDLLAASSQVAAARQMIEVERASSRPQLGLMASAEANAGDLLGHYGTNWTVMIGGRWNLFDGSGTNARVAGARHAAEEARAQRDLLAESVALEVRQAWSERRAADQRLEQALLAVQMATESLRTVEDRYRGGLIMLVELLDAQTMLTRSRAREIASRRDLIVAQASLDLAAGR